MNDNDSQFTGPGKPAKRVGARGLAIYGAKKGQRRALKHGLTTMKTALSSLGNRALDRRSKISRSLEQWRKDLIADLGGEDNISVQQITLADLCVKNKLLLDSVDTWLLAQKTLVNARRKSLFPVVLQRQQLANGLASVLNQLGLERRMKVTSLNEILSDDEQPLHSKANEANNAGNGTEQG